VFVFFFFFFWYSSVHSKSMTPISWQAAIDDEVQRPLLQDIFEASSMGIMSRENTPLPSSLFYFPVSFSWIVAAVLL